MIPALSPETAQHTHSDNRQNNSRDTHIQPVFFKGKSNKGKQHPHDRCGDQQQHAQFDNVVSPALHDPVKSIAQQPGNILIVLCKRPAYKNIRLMPVPVQVKRAAGQGNRQREVNAPAKRIAQQDRNIFVPDFAYCTHASNISGESFVYHIDRHNENDNGKNNP